MKNLNHYGRFGLLTTLASSALVSCGGKAAPEKPLNVIYIMTDDHSYQTISAYDTRYVNTPNIDRLAKEGMIFDKAYVANSISGPSRACLMTGKHSHANGFRDNASVFDGTQQTFPKLLQAAGYQTAVVGKWHLVSEPIGFDYWNILIGQGEYYNPRFIEMGNKTRKEGYATDLTTDIALNWLDNTRDKSKPFCLLLHHKAPHRTWMPKLEDLGAFDSLSLTPPDTFMDDYAGRPGAQHQKMNILKDMDEVYDLKMADKENEVTTSQPGLARAGRDMINALSPEQRKAWDAYYDPIIADFKSRKNMSDEELAQWKFERYLKDYVSCIKSVDDNIGRVYKYLEDNDMLDNTVVIYTSDQGFYMGEHGWFDKRFMYEESFRTPFIVRMPGGVKGKSSELVQNIDNGPTILDLMGVAIPEDMHGASLVPILKGETPKDWRKSLYYHFYESTDDHSVSKHYGVKKGDYKLIHFYDPIDAWELYDLSKDAKEVNNVYDDPAYATVRAEMMTELQNLQTQYNDPIKDKQ